MNRAAGCRENQTRRTRFVSLLVFSLGSSAFAADTNVSILPPPAPVQIDFARDIKPILENSCIRCHGPEKPRSHFRLDNRDSALKGGETQVDSLPGRSAESPLIEFVAGLQPDMQMPPTGKGNPLTTNQVALLRAWIDQGVNWEVTEPAPTSTANFVPTVGYTFMSGDTKKFREHYWQEEGVNGGLGEFDLWQRTGPDSTFSGNGHLLRNDYKLQFANQKDDFGFVHYGWEQYRKYFDDTGGYDPPFVPTAPSLNQDLSLTIGRAWVDFGLTLPNWPKMVLGYEYQYKRGEESTLEWGYTTPGGKAVDPASQSLNEHTHIIKFDLDHEIDGTHIEDSFRGEFYSLATHTTNIFYDDTIGSTHGYSDGESYHHFEGANTIRLERSFNDWLFTSAGYLYSKLNGSDSANVTEPGVNFQSQSITLERESHVVNLNALFGPWDGFSVSTGVQGEWTREQGAGNSLLNTIQLPTLSDYDTSQVEENVSLRYTKIPFTALFAEASLRQEQINQSMGQSADATPLHFPQFQLDTDFTSQLYDMRVGFNTSPWTWASLSAHYRRYDDQSFYNNVVDQLPLFGITPGIGYPGFLLSRDLLNNEVETKLVLRPVNWLKTTLSYKLLHSDFHTDTDPATFAAGFADISPGGEILSGRSDSSIYSINLSFTPHHRLYLSATFSWQDEKDSTAAAGLSGSASVVPYNGNIYSALGSATYVLSTNTDLTASYSYSSADFSQNNSVAGLPLSINYQQQAVQAGLTRRLGKNITAKLQYGFFHYDEPTTGGANNYNAHSIFGLIAMKMQ